MRALCVLTAAAFGWAAAPAHAATTPTVDVPGPEPKVTVILDQPGATLMRENVFGVGSVCQAPCVARVPRDAYYNVELAGSRKSDAIDLSQSPAQVRLRLRPPSNGALIGGSILTYVGVSLLPLGLMTLLVGSEIGERDLTITGAVITGAGAVSLGIGLPLLLTNRYTGVEQQPVARGLTFSRRF